MVFVLPVAARMLGMPEGIAGAWIGTSEFADAAGFAAAQTYAGYAGKVAGITGDGDQAVWAFTLMKVVGRDVWIGIWCFVLAIVATTRWDAQESGRGVDAGEIWRRFPKFVFGFIVASILVSLVTKGMSFADFNKLATPVLVAPIKDLRSWAFIFCFFSIGLTTRFRELAGAGPKPFVAFSIGVVANVLLAGAMSSRPTAAAAERRCGACRHFEGDPLALEHELKGLASLSSAFASVMADDGLCRLTDRLGSARFTCPSFVPRAG
eukprot:gene31455-41944_t